MKIRIQSGINGQNYQTESRDPVTLGRWLIEYLPLVCDTSYSAMINVWPSFDETGRPDWTADSRVLGESLQFRTPREMLAVLKDQLDRAELLK